MKFLTKEVQIGIVAILAIVVLFFGLQYLKGINILSNGNEYTIKMPDAKGLSTSNPVYSNGFRIGTVSEVNYDYENHDDMVVKITVDDKMRIPKGSKATINSDLLGNISLNIHLSDDENAIENGGEIDFEQTYGTMTKVADMVPAIEKMLPKLDSILVSVNTILADPAIKNSLHNIETISGNLTTTTRDLNTLMASLNQKVPTTIDKADMALDNANTLLTNLNTIDISSTMQKLNGTINNLQDFSKSLNNKEGTLGLLVHDRELYNNLNQTMRDADSLLVNFKQHPKRYIHFSVFGKKDK